MNNNLDFEDALKRIEEISRILTIGNVKLEESLSLYDESSNLIKYCNDVLEKAKLKITEIDSTNNLEE